MPTRITSAVCAALMACSSVAPEAAAQHRAALRSAVAIPHPIVVIPVAAGTMALGGRTSLAAAPAPRSSAGVRLGLEFLAAGAGAVGGGLGTYFLLRDASETRVKGDEGYTRAGNVGYLVGSFAGATIGAHAAGRALGGRSPIWSTSLGALIGTVPLVALGVDEPFLPLYGIVLGWIPQAALAAGGSIMAEPRYAPLPGR